MTMRDAQIARHRDGAVDNYIADAILSELVAMEQAEHDSAAQRVDRFVIDLKAHRNTWRRAVEKFARRLLAGLSDAGATPTDDPFPIRAPGTGRLLIDATHTYRIPDAHGGIPRVVRELSRAVVETGLGIPVTVKAGRLHRCTEELSIREPVEPGPNDIYVMAGVFWYFLDEYETVIDALRVRGTRVALLLHDIFPLTLPSFSPPELPPLFHSGVHRILPKADFCVSVSRTGAEEAKSHFTALPRRTDRPLGFRHFRLGVTERTEIVTGRESVKALFAQPAFVSVGTLEPRKGYSVVLDACDIAWQRGSDLRYVVIGRYGWRARALRSRIETHAEFGRRLFWIEDASDADLNYAYENCRALVQASIAEGFGLPLIEASRRGAPIIASDIPVFREIGGDAITYFSVADAENLADRMMGFPSTPQRTDAIATIGWHDSARALFACLSNETVGVGTAPQ